MEAGLARGLATGLPADRLPEGLLRAELEAHWRHPLLAQEFEARRAELAAASGRTDLAERAADTQAELRAHAEVSRQRLQNLGGLATSLDRAVLDCSEAQKCLELLSSRELAAAECVEALRRYDEELERLERELGQESESEERS